MSRSDHSRRRSAIALRLAAVGLLVVSSSGASTPMAPPRPAGVTRLVLETRPFLSLTGNGGGGTISDLVIEHYFQAPFKLWASLSPLAVAIDRYNHGSIAHARLGASYVADYFELGLAAGTRVQNLGSGGFSLAAQLRLGALDGVNVALGYGYLLARNYASDRVGTSFSDLRARVELPVGPRVKLFLDGGFSFDLWAYGTFGLTQTLGGDLAHAPWRLTAGFGLAWVVDRFGCAYRYPAPCPGTASAVGPALHLGVERRF